MFVNLEQRDHGGSLEALKMMDHWVFGGLPDDHQRNDKEHKTYSMRKPFIRTAKNNERIIRNLAVEGNRDN